MKINIRHNVFETNSSSTHSISINNSVKSIYDTLIPDTDGVIRLTGGEFGWEWESYNDPMTKANYCAMDQCNHKTNLDMLVEVIKEHTGAVDVDVSNINGYVDHQSVGTSHDAFVSKETLKNFIFSPESWLFTGNDNSSAPPNFYDVEFGIEYLYELSVEECSLTWKFQSKPDNEELARCLRDILGTRETRQYHIASEWVDEKDNSFSHIDDGIVVLFDEEHNYSTNVRTIRDRKNLKFFLKKI